MEENNSIIEFTNGGIKCDNPNCDYNDPNVIWENFEEDIEKWLNTPCPKCGTPLLTEADAASLRKLNETVTMLNNMTPEQLQKLKEFSEALGLETDEEKIMNTSISMNGSGELIFKTKPEQDDTEKTS